MKHFLLVDAIYIDGIPMVPTGDFNVLPSDSCLVDLDKILNFNRHSC